MLRIGLLGGTFNPVHAGHVGMAEDALDRFNLTQVMFIPCANPPHKEAPELAPAADRLAMLKIVTNSNQRLVVSDMEIVRGGISYSIKTVKELSVQFPGAELVFISGTDSLLELHLWKDVDELLTLCVFKTYERPGYPACSITRNVLEFDNDVACSLIDGIVAGKPVDVSSSELRKKISDGQSTEGLVAPEVEAYIRGKGLYRPR